MEKENRKLQAGFARVCITPEETVSLAGYFDEDIRRSQGVVDDIYLTCVAVSEGEDTLLLYAADLHAFREELVKQLRCVISEAVKVPQEHIFFCASHNHSAPMLYGEEPDAVRFRNHFFAAAVSAGREALVDRSSAVLYAGTKEIPGMNFVRHYRMKDGSVCGSAFGSWESGVLEHMRQPDPSMVLARFVRSRGKDIVLMNWQGHNDNTKEVGYYFISSSYPGHIRARFEEQTGMHFAFFMGASGDMSMMSRLPQLHHGLSWIDYGRRMGDYVVSALQELKPVEGSGIRTQRLQLEYDVNHSWDSMAAQAEEAYRCWKETDIKQGHALARQYGFSSAYHAMYVLDFVKMPVKGQLELSAFRIGDLGFVASTAELFSTVGIQVRAQSPFEHTFILAGNCNYMPCADAYDYRSYEADTSLFAKGTAERAAEEFVRLQHEVRGLL